MSVSIISVVFNDVAIERTLLSVLALPPNDVVSEVIVVDGGSTDGTVEAIKRAVDVLVNKLPVYLVSEKDEGIYDAMNKGIALANSDYLLFLNAGDFLTSDAIDEILVSSFVLSKRKDIHVFPILSMSQDGDYLPVRFWKDLSDMRYRPIIPHQSTLISRKLLSARPYDTRYKILADYKSFCEFYDLGASFAVESVGPISVFTQGGVSNSYSKQLVFLSELFAIQNEVFKQRYFRYAAVPILKWCFYRFSRLRKFDRFFRIIFRIDKVK